MQIACASGRMELFFSELHCLLKVICKPPFLKNAQQISPKDAQKSNAHPHHNIDCKSQNYITPNMSERNMRSSVLAPEKKIPPAKQCTLNSPVYSPCVYLYTFHVQSCGVPLLCMLRCAFSYKRL